MQMLTILSQGCMLIVLMVMSLRQVSCLFYENMDCSSINYKYAKCIEAAATSITSMQMICKYSVSDCVANESYGYKDNYIWVDHGCRAKFNIGTIRKLMTKTITCKSEPGKCTECTVPGAIFVVHVHLNDQQSYLPCEPRTSYGMSLDKIYASNGCAGAFEVKYY